MTADPLHQRLLAELDDYERAMPQPGNLIDALRVVVERHEPFQRSMLTLGCRACSTPVLTQPGRFVTVVNFPCPDIQAIARELGVDGG